ncbi:YdeI/OmpD-associated family protein [Hymenobacter tibetensis]|uniref:YdeI/OmpD-associated family protein n=1 Tax=Hymenobacter tibetensis TaxID=497967 RepID=A0ABY4D679_9BACT|nr:YdeI/OmpD-associated family protein [Hymenobacter tibetensis]UOG75503.1 YdeI/OmpD-associated family protein [Hymenobacter tibetensis]
MPIQLLNALVTLAKFSGKGGWTYAPLPTQVTAPNTYFNKMRVSGSIDDLALENLHLMSMGQGRLFLPVNAALRNQLGKQAGDTVRLVLFHAEEDAPLLVSTDDFEECLAGVAGALESYKQLPLSAQHAWVAWVASAPTDQQKVTRAEAVCTRLALCPHNPTHCLPPV